MVGNYRCDCGIALMFDPIDINANNKWLFEIAFPNGHDFHLSRCVEKTRMA